MILGFSGSQRLGSHNQRLVRVCARYLERLGTPTQVINLGDYPLPLFNEDLEIKSLPPTREKLRSLVSQSSGFVIASPEYNGFPTPLLLNFFAWVDRSEHGEEAHSAFGDKPVALLATSTGARGARRALDHTANLFTTGRARVLEPRISIPRGQDLVTESAITDQGLQDNIESLMRLLANESRPRA